MKNSFGELFKTFRLKSGFSSLSEFGKALAIEGVVLEDSIFSRWQKGNRIPKDRNLLLIIVTVFIKKESIISIKQANALLDSADQGYLTEPELQKINNFFIKPIKLPPPKKTIEFIMKIGKSKKIARSGWIREEIKDPESVAEHSFQLSVLAMVLADQLGVDKEKLIKMALLHDLGAIVTKDIVWSRGGVVDMKKESEKIDLEKKEITKVFKIIGRSKEYLEIFQEMIEKTTQEAKIFWELDKLEMAIQALDYELSQNKKLDEFFINADFHVSSTPLRKILDEILKQRRVRKLKREE